MIFIFQVFEIWNQDAGLEIVIFFKLEIYAGGPPCTGKPAATSFANHTPLDANSFQRRFWII